MKYSSSVEFRGGNDDYNFINIFKKRGINSTPGFSSSLQAQTSKLKQISKGSSLNNRKQTTEVYDDDYTEEFTTYTKKKEVKLSQPELNKSSVSTVSSSSSSSDSTSLSKYMMSVNTMPKRGSASHDSASRKSTHKSTHLISSASYEQHLNGHMQSGSNGVNNEENESLSSNESISSKVSSNSSSSQSTTLSLMVNKSLPKSKQVTPPKSAQPQSSLSLSKSQCKLTLILSLKISLRCLISNDHFSTNSLIGLK